MHLCIFVSIDGSICQSGHLGRLAVAARTGQQHLPQHHTALQYRGRAPPTALQYRSVPAIQNGGRCAVLGWGIVQTMHSSRMGYAFCQYRTNARNH
eukprot:3936308-Rhodomonas_salina.1